MKEEKLEKGNFADEQPSVEEQLKKFNMLLMTGAIQEAAKFYSDENLLNTDLKPIVKKAFNAHNQKGNWRHAIRIAEEFEFIDEDLKHLKIEEYLRLTKTGEFEEAARWAQEHKLSDMEISQAAKLSYKSYIQKGEVDEAFRVLDEFNLDPKELLNETIVEFNTAYENKEYYKAAVIGDKFNFSRVRTLTAAVQACVSAINNEDYSQFVRIIFEFLLFREKSVNLLHEKEAKEFFCFVIENFVEPAFSKGNLKILQEFAEKSDILVRSFEHEAIIDFVKEFSKTAVTHHNKALNSDDLKTSRFILDTFRLFEAPLPTEIRASLIEASEKYHNSLLKAGELDKAIEFKNHYGLFEKHILRESMEKGWKEAALYVIKILEKGDLRSARKALDEYKVPEYLRNDAVYQAISNLMNEQKYEVVFAIQKEFKLDRSKRKVSEGLLNMFHELMNRREYIIAAEFGELFHLNKTFIEDAAFKAWQKEFRNKNYDSAEKLKKKYKISRRNTLPLATQTYWSFMENKDFSMAVHIRKSYGVRLSFGQIFMEFLRRIFGR